jgi:putative phosphoribosyl transferase
MSSATCFADRQEAGQDLAKLLRPRGINFPIVVAVGRGGIPIAIAIQAELGGEVTALSVFKLTAEPGGETLGAVASEGTRYWCDDRIDRLRVDRRDLERQADVLAGQASNEQQTRASAWSEGLVGRPVLVVDDAVQTGATAAAAIAAVRKTRPALVIFAVPAGEPTGIERIRSMADEVICARPEIRFEQLNQLYER